MRVPSLNLIRNLLIVFTTMGLLMFQSCKNSDVNGQNPSPGVNAENLRDLTASDLEDMKGALKASGIDVDTLDIYAAETPVATKSSQSNAPAFASPADILVKAIKVTTTTTNPNGSGTIPISGVLLVPKRNSSTLRILVAPVYTYTNNQDAPSNLFKSSLSMVKNNGDINFLYFCTLQATQGFAVLFPDYPGFGDSYQKAFIPFLMKEPMVNSTLDLIRASQETLKNNKYNYKKELLIGGYSLGGYVATALAKRLDSDNDLPVKLTVAGGAPLDLLDLVTRAQKASTLPISFIYPYTLLAYNINESTPFTLSDVLQSRYDKAYLTDAFNGTRNESDLISMFPDKPSELFTSDAIDRFETDAKYANLRGLLSKNSVEPWKNTNKLVLIHGTSDSLVYYESTRNFYNKQKDLGGNINFAAIPFAGHLLTLAPFYVELSFWLIANK